MARIYNRIGEKIVPGLVAGSVIGVFNIIFGISLAALVFAGDLAHFAANGIGLILLGGIPPLLVVSLFSTYRGNIALIQDAPAAILAVMVASMVQRMAGSAPEAMFNTVLVVIVLTTLSTGLFLVLLGRYKLGSLVRYLPYPVVGGFLAGTGWLLIVGGIGVMTDVGLDLANLSLLLQPEIALRWMPGLAMAIVMLLILNRFDHFLILPLLLTAIFGLFYAATNLAGASVPALGAQGWLLGPFTQTDLMQTIRLLDLGLVEWDLILAQAGNIATIAVITLVSLLLNASGLEIIVRKDFDLNRELQVTGWANIAAGLLGGIISYHGVADTAINYKVGKGSRLTGWVAAALHGAPLLFGVVLLNFIPKIALGTILIYVGVSFLYDWVYQAWFKVSRLEYVIILGIWIGIAGLGFLEGVGIGIVAAIILFVFNYSQVEVARHVLSGAEIQSRHSRTRSQQQTLLANGDRCLILQLQGFIFFGTAIKMLEQVRERLDQSDRLPLQFLILDFRRVRGVDSTAMLSFAKMKQILRERDALILVTAADGPILTQLQRSGFAAANGSAATVHPDLDHGLEWVEDRILAPLAERPVETMTLKEMFFALLPAEERLDELLGYLQKIELRTGEYLVRQGDAPEDIYFIEQGQVTAQLEHLDRSPVRLESMRAGYVIGELGFYLGQVRTASVVADEPTTTYVLTSDNLAAMESGSPRTASYFHRLIVLLLARRTTHLIRTVSALER